MLQVQVEYQKMREQIRHNMEDEAIRWANTQIEQLKYEEQKRHNLSTEQLGRLELAEKIRHNLVSESQKDKELAISLYATNVKAGELSLKQMIEPLKAKASLISAQGAAMRGNAALQEIPIKQQQADTKAVEVRNANVNARYDRAQRREQANQTYETARDRNVIESNKSEWQREHDTRKLEQQRDLEQQRIWNEQGRTVIESLPKIAPYISQGGM